ncbi:sialate O-acetylesterase [Viscerimonas tarda]
MNLIKAFASICLVLSVSAVEAKIKLPSILGDNMVLQQQTVVKLWGEAKPNAAVTIIPSWNKKVYSAKSDSDGKWLALIPTTAAGGPYTISFSDGEKLQLTNILIGEVWFCSGQSNMEMPVKGFDRQPVQGSIDVIAKANPKTPIRMFTTDSEDGKWVRQFDKKPQADCKGRWMINSPENVANTSAAGYHFARYIQEALDVPVGLVISTWGGSKVEAWMSRESIEPFKEVDLSILDNAEEVKNPTATPCVLYNAKIAPLTNFAIKGFLWYQGESNRTSPELYEGLTPAFVKDLRSRWNVGEFPFYFVQIAPYNYDGADKTSGARFREAQEQNMKDIPNSGMVTTQDVGDLGGIHPVNKEAVGKRLAYWALGNTYGIKGFDYAPPTYKSMEKAEGKIYINFDNAQRGINPMWTDLKGFEIAGDDKVFHPAKAEIETKTARLAVSSPDVPNPVAARYAYKNYAEASIFGASGIPVAPFRTDKW